MEFLSFKNKTFKSIILTLLFYLTYFLTSIIAEQFHKSGPCNPGLGIIILFFLPLITTLLLIINLIKYYHYEKKHLYGSVLIHSIATLCFLFFYIYITNV